MYGPDEADPPSAILTDRQREWLTGELDDISAGAERAMKARIRDRIQAGIFDMTLVLEQLDVADIEKALSEPDWANSGATDIPPLENAISALGGILYLRCHELEREVGQRDDDRPDGRRTGLHVRGGIERALTRLGIAAEDITVDVRVTRGESLEDVAETGDLSAVGRKQLARMKRDGHITAEEYSEEMSHRILNIGDGENKERED